MLLDSRLGIHLILSDLAREARALRKVSDLLNHPQRTVGDALGSGDDIPVVVPLALDHGHPFPRLTPRPDKIAGFRVRLSFAQRPLKILPPQRARALTRK